MTLLGFLFAVLMALAFFVRLVCKSRTHIQIMWLYVYGLLTNQGTLLASIYFRLYTVRKYWNPLKMCHSHGMTTLSRIFIGGFHIKLRKWPIFLLIVFWSLSVFVLITIYTALLISDVTIPKMKPLINGISDLRYRNDINLVTDRKANANVYLLVSKVLILWTTFI